MSISVANITKIYGTQKAVDSVSFEIKPGEIVGLLGPNGAGKSTLMKMLTCFIPSTSGEASVCGFDVLEQSIEVRKRVGYLPENNPLYLDMYVREFLLFVDQIHQPFALRHSPKNSEKRKVKSEKRISEIIDLTGLAPEQHKKIGALSRGYRQRVGIAQALMHDPQVLILDEPTSGLDPNQLLEIRALIQSIGKEKTVMLSTHIMQEVEAICHRAIIINNGKIVADSLTKNIGQQGKSKTVIIVEFNTPVNPKQLLAIPGVYRVFSPGSIDPAQIATAWYVEAEESIDVRPAIFTFAVDNNLMVLSMQKEEQKLEAVFQELTKGK